TLSLMTLGTVVLLGMDSFLPYWLGLPLEGLLLAWLVEIWWHRQNYESLYDEVVDLKARVAERLEESEYVKALVAERDVLLRRLNFAISELQYTKAETEDIKRENSQLL